MQTRFGSSPLRPPLSSSARISERISGCKVNYCTRTHTTHQIGFCRAHDKSMETEHCTEPNGSAEAEEEALVRCRGAGGRPTRLQGGDQTGIDKTIASSKVTEGNLSSPSALMFREMLLEKVRRCVCVLQEEAVCRLACARVCVRVCL